MDKQNDEQLVLDTGSVQLLPPSGSSVFMLDPSTSQNSCTFQVTYNSNTVIQDPSPYFLISDWDSSIWVPDDSVIIQSDGSGLVLFDNVQGKKATGSFSMQSLSGTQPGSASFKIAVWDNNAQTVSPTAEQYTIVTVSSESTIFNTTDACFIPSWNGVGDPQQMTFTAKVEKVAGGTVSAGCPVYFFDANDSANLESLVDVYDSSGTTLLTPVAKYGQANVYSAATNSSGIAGFVLKQKKMAGGAATVASRIPGSDSPNLSPEMVVIYNLSNPSGVADLPWPTIAEEVQPGDQVTPGESPYCHVTMTWDDIKPTDLVMLEVNGTRLPTLYPASSMSVAFGNATMQVPYSNFHKGPNTLKYAVYTGSKSFVYSDKRSFNLTDVPQNQPSNQVDRIYLMPRLFSAEFKPNQGFVKGKELKPGYQIGYEDVYPFGLIAEIPGSGAGHVPFSTLVTLNVYRNGVVNDVQTSNVAALDVTTAGAGDDTDYHIDFSSYLQGYDEYENGALGGFYLEYFVKNTNNYSQYWSGTMDTVPAHD